MALVLDATVGGSAANSYATLDAFRAVMDATVSGTTADDFGDDDIARALAHATRLLDTYYEWRGEIASLDQALLWPRRGVLRIGIVEGQTSSSFDPWRDYGVPFATFYGTDEIPAIIVQAACEYARQLLLADRTVDSDLETSSIKSLSAGGVSLTFGNVSAKPIPDAVAVLATQLGQLRSAAGGAVHLYRS